MPLFGKRLEGVVQIGIMLVIGGAAGAASFTMSTTWPPRTGSRVGWPRRMR